MTALDHAAPLDDWAIRLRACGAVTQYLYSFEPDRGMWLVLYHQAGRDAGPNTSSRLYFFDESGRLL